MSDPLDEMLKSTPGGVKNKEAILALANSPDAKRFFQMLKQKDSGELQAAAQAAMKGDTGQLTSIVNEITKSPEGAKVVDNLTKNR